ncbi:MAG: hypothetical protein ACRC5A_00345, partial [Enterobacteriaceae bacterium]
IKLEFGDNINIMVLDGVTISRDSEGVTSSYGSGDCRETTSSCNHDVIRTMFSGVQDTMELHYDPSSQQIKAYYETWHQLNGSTIVLRYKIKSNNCVASSN